jgi:hypothetical protein
MGAMIESMTDEEIRQVILSVDPTDPDMPLLIEKAMCAALGITWYTKEENLRRLQEASLKVDRAILAARGPSKPHTSRGLKTNTGVRKYTDDVAMQIRHEYKSGASLTDLAAKYNGSASGIRSIVTGQTYKHLPME